MLNLIKKVTAVIVVVLVTIKVLIFDTFALSVAPVGIQILIEAFGALLVGSGMYTAEEVNDMSWSEVQFNLEQGISSGVISTSDIIVDGQLWLNEQGITNAAVIDVVDTAIDVWINDLTAEDVVGVTNTDLLGGTCMFKYVSSTGVVYCYYSYGTGIIKENGYYYLPEVYLERKIYTDGDYKDTVRESPNSKSIPDTYGTSRSIYGSWIDATGKIVETGEATSAEVGETADGEKVTLDDIQSGAVSLDDTTVDYDAFDDDAIIDLLNQILAELEQVPVVDDTGDNTLAEDFADNVSVSVEMEDLQSLQLPTGIATVFPFCLPFDFAYGLQLLAAKPVPPKFEIAFEIPAFGLYPGTSDVITLDMAEYSKYFEVGRWVQVVLFSIGLCFISFKVVKGVH